MEPDSSSQVGPASDVRWGVMSGVGSVFLILNAVLTLHGAWHVVLAGLAGTFLFAGCRRFMRLHRESLEEFARQSGEKRRQR